MFQACSLFSCNTFFWNTLSRTIKFLFFESVDSMEDREAESASCGLLNLWSHWSKNWYYSNPQPQAGWSYWAKETKIHLEGRMKRLWDPRKGEIQRQRGWRLLQLLHFLDPQYSSNNGFSKTPLYPSRKSPFTKERLRRFLFPETKRCLRRLVV